MYDTGIIVFCNITEKVLKSNGIILILPFMRDPSTCERERVKSPTALICSAFFVKLTLVTFSHIVMYVRTHLTTIELSGDENKCTMYSRVPY